MTFKVTVRVVPGESAPVPADWRSVLAKFPPALLDAWEERAAIIQYDGQEPRPTAERRAFDCIVRSEEEADALLRAHIAVATGRVGGHA